MIRDKKNTKVKYVTIHSPSFKSIQELDEWESDLAELLGVDEMFLNIEWRAVNAEGEWRCKVEQNIMNCAKT